MLVKTGLETADSHRRKTYAMGSLAGWNVYKQLQLGCEIVETVPTDYSVRWD
jgi:hypothetical protein